MAFFTFSLQSNNRLLQHQGFHCSSNTSLTVMFGSFNWLCYFVPPDLCCSQSFQMMRVCFASMLAKRKRTPVLCAEHLTCVQVHECHHPHPSPSVAEHLTCVQVHECHHPHPSPAVAEHLTCVQVPHPSPAVAEHLTCVQVHECHHPHPTPPPVPLFSCKIHRDHVTVPATNIAPENGWLEVGILLSISFHLGRPIFRSYVGVYITSNISTS